MNPTIIHAISGSVKIRWLAIKLDVAADQMHARNLLGMPRSYRGSR
jgi:hypothetical protein